MSEYLRPEYTPLFREVQDTIAGYLNSDPQISAKQIQFIPEAHLDIDFQVKKALGQQGIVGVVNTLKGEFAGHDGSTNAWQIEAEVDVIENPPVRRPQLKKMGLSTGTVSDIIDWVQESLCGPSSPTFARFSPVTQEIGESNGLVVGRSIMRSIVIADVSAVISGGSQWKCPYALRSELSALYEEVKDISGQIEDAVTEDEMSAYVAQQLSGYLPAEIYGAHDEWATVKKVIEIQDVRPDSGDEPVLTLVQNDSQRSLEIINTPSLATLNFGILSSGVPKMSFGIEDPETFNTVYFQNKSGTLAYQSDLSGCLPFDGDDTANVYVNSLSAADGIYAMKSIPQRLITSRTGFTGIGQITQYQKAGNNEHNYDTLILPKTEDGQNKTIATREWTQGEISGKADTTALANYLPLSGGNVDGYLSVGNNVVLEYDLGGGVVRLSDGNGNWTYLQGNRISNNGSNFYFPLPPYPDDYTLATQEWTTQTAFSSYMKATAMTQAEYDQITPDPTTLYVITED